MEIKTLGQEIKGGTTATVRLDSGDYISIAYTDPRGTTNVITVSAHHLVMIAMHEDSDTSIICRPEGITVVD